MVDNKDRTVKKASCSCGKDFSDPGMNPKIIVVMEYLTIL